MRHSLTITGSLLLSFSAYAERRHHGAHEHGAAMLSIAVEKSNIEIELDLPAESAYGFEHEPRTPQEKKAQADAFGRWTTNAGAILGLPAALGCKVVKAEAELEAEGHDDEHDDAPKATAKGSAAVKATPAPGHEHEHGHAKTAAKTEEHADVSAEATLRCSKDLALGTTFTIDPKKVFPKIKSLKVQLVGGAQQKGANFSKFPGTLSL